MYLAIAKLEFEGDDNDEVTSLATKLVDELANIYPQAWVEATASWDLARLGSETLSLDNCVMNPLVREGLKTVAGIKSRSAGELAEDLEDGPGRPPEAWTRAPAECGVRVARSTTEGTEGR